MFIKNAQVQNIPVIDGITRKTLSVGERAMVVEIHLKQGADMPEHAHPHEQLGYVVSGKVEFYIEDEMMLLEKGDAYAVPSQQKHKVVVLEDSVVVDIFAPPRDEWR